VAHLNACWMVSQKWPLGLEAEQVNGVWFERDVENPVIDCHVQAVYGYL
jgi:hypothetical protein